MSAQQVSSMILVCDGCQAELHDGEMFRTAMEARAAAYNEGWRFPARTTSTGKPSGGRTSDVCPTCLPGWQPEPVTARHGYRRLDGTPGVRSPIEAPAAREEPDALRQRRRQLGH